MEVLSKLEGTAVFLWDLHYRRGQPQVTENKSARSFSVSQKEERVPNIKEKNLSERLNQDLHCFHFGYCTLTNQHWGYASQ